MVETKNISKKKKKTYSVLIVDDDPNNRFILRRYLQKDEYFVLTASNADEAFSILDVLVPDAILLDYQMPNIDGLEVLRRIRETNKQSVVILMTAYNSDEVELDAILHEADDYLPKPLNFKSLGKKIKAHIIKRHNMFASQEKMAENILYKKIEKESNNIFSHFLIMDESIPVFSLGSWGSLDNIRDGKNKNMSHADSELLISGLLSAIKDFSRVVFGENIGHISMGTYQIILHQTDKYLLSLVISTTVYKFLDVSGKINIVKTALLKISEILNEQSTNNEFGGLTSEIPEFMQEEIKKILTDTAISVITDNNGDN